MGASYVPDVGTSSMWATPTLAMKMDACHGPGNAELKHFVDAYSTTGIVICLLSFASSLAVINKLATRSIYFTRRSAHQLAQVTMKQFMESVVSGGGGDDDDDDDDDDDGGRGRGDNHELDDGDDDLLLMIMNLT
jgi:hypothetical protein